MSLNWVEPTTIEEASDCIIGASRAFLTGDGFYKDFRLGLFPRVGDALRRDTYLREQAKGTSFPHWDESLKKLDQDPDLVVFEDAIAVSLEESRSEIEVYPDDQVAVIPSHLPIGNVNACLAQYGLCLPIADQDEFGIAAGLSTIGSLISLNLPHVLEKQCGTWKDWILGMKLVMADGTIAKSGSKAVKSVAGYDVHKLLIGARGSFGLIWDVTLRVSAVSSVPRPDCLFKSPVAWSHAFWIQRVALSDFAKAYEVARENTICADNATGTIWAQVEPSDSLPRYPGDWVIRSGCGEKNVQISDPAQIKLMKRAKQAFDPTNKLNPGEWGFM